MGAPTGASVVHPVGRAELLRVLTTKTKFWYMYKEYARGKSAAYDAALAG